MAPFSGATVSLRISNVVTLSREHIKSNRLEKLSVKNHKWIRVELPPAVLEALDLLPPPKAALRDNKRYAKPGKRSVADDGRRLQTIGRRGRAPTPLSPHAGVRTARERRVDREG